MLVVTEREWLERVVVVVTGVILEHMQECSLGSLECNVLIHVCQFQQTSTKNEVLCTEPVHIKSALYRSAPGVQTATCRAKQQPGDPGARPAGHATQGGEKRSGGEQPEENTDRSEAQPGACVAHIKTASYVCQP